MRNSLALLSALLLASCVAASPMPTPVARGLSRRQGDINGFDVVSFVKSVSASGTTTAFDTQNTGTACDRLNFDGKCCHSGVVIDRNCYAKVAGFDGGEVAAANNAQQYAFVSPDGTSFSVGPFSISSVSGSNNGQDYVSITDDGSDSGSVAGSGGSGSSGGGNTYGPGQSCDANGNGCNFGGSPGDGGDGGNGAVGGSGGDGSDSSSAAASASATPTSSASQSAANTVAAQTTSTSEAGGVQASASSSDSGSSSSSKKPLGGSNGAPSLQSGAQAATALIVAAIAGAFAI